jgi:MFS family permease
MLEDTRDAISTDQEATSMLRSIVPLLILASAMAAGFAVMNSFGVIQESAKAGLGMSDTVLSLIQGPSIAIQVTLLSIPIGIMVDRFNRVRLLFLLGVVWTVGTALTAFAGDPWLLFAGRMLASIGGTGGLTAALSLGADLCPPAKRGRALLIVMLGKCVGQAAAVGLTGWLFGVFLHGTTLPLFANLAPWRSAHYALAMVSLMLVIPPLFLREPVRHEVAAGTHAPFRTSARELWSLRRFLMPLFIGLTSVVMADAAAAIWAAPALSRGYGLAPEQFSGWMGAVIFAMGVAGAIIGGFAADWGQKVDRKGGILLGAVIAAGVGIPSALFPVAPSVPTFGFALGTLLLCGTVAALVSSVAVTVLIPNELRGLCIGVAVTMSTVMGFGVAPVVVVWVSRLLGGEMHLGEALAIVGMVGSVVSLAAFALAMRRAPLSPTTASI